MLRNYLKIAIAVLKRRKFFTAVSLFVISFTLMVLMILAAFIDKIITDNYPDKKRDRSLYITTIEQIGYKHGSRNGGSFSYYFLDHYTSGLKMPKMVAISSNYKGTNTYVNNKKIEVNYKYTNAAYWDLLDYDFLEGKPFSKQQVDNSEKVTVISEDMKRKYFGDTGPVVGKYLEADNIQYRVTGVVKNVPITTFRMYSDIYLPYTVSKTSYKDKSYGGDYTAILLAEKKSDLKKMRREFDEVVRRIPMSSDEYDELHAEAEPYMAAYLSTGNKDKSGVTIILTAISIFVFLFMLLPTLNLININITRIMERSSEIGVRKAFGASSKTLVYQFLVENIILTLLGGLLGVILSLIAMQIFNQAMLIANFELTMNFTVLLYGLAACLVFGLLSGVYPAWRMSRMKVVTALKAI